MAGMRAGGKLIAFDRDKIDTAGHPDVAAVMMTNSNGYDNLTAQTGVCRALDKVVRV